MAANDAMKSAMESAVVTERTAAAARVFAEQAQEKLLAAQAALADLRAIRDIWIEEAQTSQRKHAKSRQLADDQARAVSLCRVRSPACVPQSWRGPPRISRRSLV
ncbi:hypothetical protein CH295_26775 [Rhodococcus sp. 14-2483-1-2]|nr:hypothetical protein CH295_26775 [Rhodococcus sp. 14-2483-1-2]